MTTVSLIITCHNQHSYLQQLIGLLENYLDLKSELEVIIVDSSFDETLLPAYLQYYRIPNKGPSYARNFGITKATCDFVVFCDADDVVNPFSIKYASRFMGKATDAVYFDFKRVEDSQIMTEAESNYKDFTYSSPIDLKTINDPVYFLRKFFPVHAVIFRRSVFNKIKFYEPQWLIEDVRFYLELSLVPGILLEHCTDPNYQSFHRDFKEKKSLSTSSEILFWEGISANYHYLGAHSQLSIKQKFKLTKLLLLNYHIVNSDLKQMMLKKNKLIWNYFLGLPKLLRNRMLFRMIKSLIRFGR
jgi:glycosyltransferase involved in cell wall biosynthesis